MTERCSTGCSIRVAASQLKIPPVWANSYETVDAATSISNERGKRHDALDGVALSVRNSQLDKSASVCRTELLTVTVSRTSRRNVLGAIALKRSIATSRGDDNRDECKTSNTAQPTRLNSKQQITSSATVAQRLRWRPFSLDRLFQERSHPPMLDVVPA
jgi:hypothetical protein